MPDEIDRGFGNLWCPDCNSTTEFFLLLDECHMLRCADCTGEWNADEMAELTGEKSMQMLDWQRALLWIATAPTIPTTPDM